jgi:hypothetical protein
LSTTTALWVNSDLAKEGTDDVSSVLQLRRVEPCEASKTAEGRRHRKDLAIFTLEEDIGVSTKSLQQEQIRSMEIRSMEIRGEDALLGHAALTSLLEPAQDPPIPTEVHILTDLSASSWNCSDSGAEGSEDLSTTLSDDSASTSAANVLIMLSRA